MSLSPDTRPVVGSRGSLRKVAAAMFFLAALLSLVSFQWCDGRDPFSIYLNFEYMSIWNILLIVVEVACLCFSGFVAYNGSAPSKIAFSLVAAAVFELVFMGLRALGYYFPVFEMLLTNVQYAAIWLSFACYCLICFNARNGAEGLSKGLGAVLIAAAVLLCLLGISPFGAVDTSEYAYATHYWFLSGLIQYALVILGVMLYVISEAVDGKSLMDESKNMPKKTPSDVSNGVQAPQVVVVSQPSNSQLDAYDEIAKLKNLLDLGAITQEEFEAKKKQLL